MENILIWLYFGTINFFLLKNYRIIESQKSRLKLYIVLSVSVLLCFISSCLIMKDNFIFALSGNVFLILSILLIRMLWKPQKWYAVLFLPLAVFFSICLASLNKPVYYGAMDGFVNYYRIVFAMLIIFFLFPIFIFLHKMLNLKQIFKSTILILTAFAGFAYGITLSIGKDGYLSDNTGVWFLFLSVWLVTIGLVPLFYYKTY